MDVGSKGWEAFPRKVLTPEQLEELYQDLVEYNRQDNRSLIMRRKQPVSPFGSNN